MTSFDKIKSSPWPGPSLACAYMQPSWYDNQFACSGIYTAGIADSESCTYRELEHSTKAVWKKLSFSESEQWAT